jgi:diaminopimelate decarboxylase
VIEFHVADDGRPGHAPLPDWDSRDGCLTVAGEPVTALMARFGPEPLYVYDRSLMDRQVARLRRALPDGLQLHYAVKANPMDAVVRHMAGATDGLDVASAGELRLAMAAGVPPGRISFAGPGKSAADLEAAAAAGVIVCLESVGEAERLAAVARRTGCRPPVAIRVNPDFELKYSGLRMGGGARPFGIDAEQVPDLLRRLRDMPLEFLGFHIYCGGQTLEVDSLIEAQRRTFDLALQLAREAPAPVRWLNIGGGFGLPYFPGEQALDPAPLGAALEPLLQRARQQLPGVEPVLELGRYLVGGAGVYLCRVLDRKVSRGRVFLITNGGLHHHLAATGNFGQVLRKNYPVAIANRLGSTSLEEVSIVGPLCTPLDLLADRTLLPRAEVGDIVAVFQSGAYGFSASPHAFLSHPPPSEICL